MVLSVIEDMSSILIRGQRRKQDPKRRNHGTLIPQCEERPNAVPSLEANFAQ